MPNRYLVLSDLHLCDVEEHEDGWKAFKRATFLFDAELDALVEHFVATTSEGTRAVLVLNGDIFDFDIVTETPTDAAFHVTADEKRRGLHPTADKSVWKLERMLSFHEPFLRTLARFVGRGHQLVYLFGNHDREFHFPEVQAAFVRALRSAGEDASFADDAIRFEPWCFHVPGEIYVEHGNQYDGYTSFRHLLWPTIHQRGEVALALPMGNLTNRLLMNRMGFFNPHASDYILNVYRYITHWFQHYAFSKHSIVLEWLFGSITVVKELLDSKRLLMFEPKQSAAELEKAEKRIGLPRATLEALQELQQPPITTRFFGIVRELWLDRVLLVSILATTTLVLALVPIPLWIKLMLPLAAFPLVYFIYEEIVKGETIFTIEHRLPERARAIGAMLDVKVVTFGHSHKPRVIPLDRDLLFVDTGTWAPIMRRLDDKRLVPGYRNYLIADFSTPEPSTKLACWGDRDPE